MTRDARALITRLFSRRRVAGGENSRYVYKFGPNLSRGFARLERLRDFTVGIKNSINSEPVVVVLGF